MNINIFDKKYKACSNIFTETVEQNNYIFPYPTYIYATIENESKNTRNLIEFKFSSFYDSILILDGYFDIFFYLLDFDYKITTLHIKNILLESSNQDMYGYKGSYLFSNGNLILNVTEDNYYDDYCKICKSKTNV